MEQKTIAELWEQLQGYEGKKMRECPECGWHGGYHEIKCSGAENIKANTWALTLPPVPLEEFKSIRQQLLELARLVKDAEGFCTRFEIYTEQGVPNSKTYIHAIGGTRFDNQETAANYIAAYAFWAWELEQRKSETNG